MEIFKKCILSCYNVLKQNILLPQSVMLDFHQHHLKNTVIINS